jgi:hypothetical protein
LARRCLAALLPALLAVLAGTGPANAAPPTDAYDVLGAWIDIFDPALMNDPVETIDDLERRGVDTVYVETSNFTQGASVVRREKIKRMIDAAHARGMALVTWYLPGFNNLRRDFHRSKAAIKLKSDGGERPDSFALDIESTAVADPGKRNRRLRKLSRRLRRVAGPDYALGAIIPSPRGMRFAPTYWPGFPYDSIDRRYDVFLPMAYSTYHEDDGYSGREGVRRYTAQNIRILRKEAGDNVPIQMVGGIADRLSRSESAGLTEAVLDREILGGGLYDVATMSGGDWDALAPLSN